MSLVVDISKRIRSTYKTVEFDFKLDVNNGQALGVFGPTGSGKSTLLRLISGLIKPDHGSISLNGKTWFGNERTSVQKRNIGFVFQHEGLFPHLNVFDNLKLSGSTQTQTADMLEQFDMTSLMQAPIQSLSGGQYQKVSILRSLLQKPDLLLLDEPFSAQDNEGKTILKRKLLEFIEKTNTPTILVSHNVKDLKDLCKAYYKVECGKGQMLNSVVQEEELWS